MTHFASLGVIKNRITKIYPKLYHNGKLWPDHLSCFVNLFLYDPANTAWLFEKFLFELEAFYGFKITCILVRQVIFLLKKWWRYQQNLLFNFMVSYLYLFNPCISISENGRYLSPVTYNSMKVDTPGELLILLLDWILVYATSVLQMNLPP